MGEVVRFELPAALGGMRVDRAVAMVCSLPRSAVSALIGSGRVIVSGAPVKSASQRLEAGTFLEVELPDQNGPKGLAAEEAVEFGIVYSDDDIAVVDKPAGLVVHPGAGVSSGTLVNGLLARFPMLGGLVASGACDAHRPGIVHRLDRGTSGLMVVALSHRAFSGLSAAIASREVVRTYRTLVWGRVDEEAGVVQAPVGRSQRDRTLMAVSAGGKDAATRYLVVERFEETLDVTLLEATLESGRTHQIRVHMSALGHPVVGDERYGGAANRRRDPERIVRLARPFLHAWELSFSHPVTGEYLAFQSPLPDDLDGLLARLRGGKAPG